ncbi:hypothetical protein T492DRAFT_243612 [Pavlovales sp. CCMP2436]|nr:hypothetical protein T492DRAFT_243612 [Pavlovales sp. CCMP2436]
MHMSDAPTHDSNSAQSARAARAQSFIPRLCTQNRTVAARAGALTHCWRQGELRYKQPQTLQCHSWLSAVKTAMDPPPCASVMTTFRCPVSIVMTGASEEEGSSMCACRMISVTDDAALAPFGRRKRKRRAEGQGWAASQRGACEWLRRNWEQRWGEQ